MGRGIPIWDAGLLDANTEQLRFQVAALRRQERRKQRFEISVAEMAMRGMRQMLIGLLGLDLTIPHEDRGRDGRGPAVPLPMLINSPEMAKRVDDLIYRAKAEKDATEDELKEHYSKTRLDEALGRDTGDDHAKLDNRLASLSLQEMAAAAHNEEVYTERLRRAGFDTLTVPAEAFQRPQVAWEEAEQVRADEREERRQIIDEAPADDFLDFVLDGLKPGGDQ